jgi:starvation-inducible outer membrane lipoprotein
MESDMKNKLLIVLLLGAFVLTSCGSMPSVSLGSEAKKNAEAMELQTIQPEPTEATLSEDNPYYRDELDDDINNDWA